MQFCNREPGHKEQTVTTIGGLQHFLSSVDQFLQYFKYQAVLKIMHDVHLKLCPGFPRQKRHSTTEDHFNDHIELKLRKNPVKLYIWNTAFFGVEI